VLRTLIGSALQWRQSRQGEFVWDLQESLRKITGERFQSGVKRKISPSDVAGPMGGGEVPQFVRSAERARMKVIVVYRVV
jgi:hypothetical protein